MDRWTTEVNSGFKGLKSDVDMGVLDKEEEDVDILVVQF